MTLTAAQDAITAEFSLADKDAAHDDAREITSGGERKEREIEPAMFSTEAGAVAFWKREVLDYLRAEKATTIRFIEGPYLDTWRITIADKKNTHRISADRYSVTARIGIIREAVPAVESVVETLVPDLPKPKPAKAAKKKVAAA